MSFFIETSWGSLLKWGEELCGDRVELVKQEDGVLLVLSDGLGSGVKANILAGLTSKIITSMVTAGAELKDVVDTIASTLPVCKVREVAYSTFTMMQVDHEGNAYLVEFDNPTVILLRNGKRVFIPWVEQNISGKQIREAHLKLKLGDIAVTFSDGIIHAGVGRLLNLGWQHENVVQFLEETWQADDTAYDVQHRLLNECNSLYQGHPGDDTTVAALRICVPNPCCVMVGPPVHPEDDEEVVGELLACPGIKVICGGTTSQIVSKRLGKELKILLQYISPDVPPIATMEGIDLVTEGVVTLGKTLEQNLLSVVFDYEGNLWFATGGFRIYPERAQQGVVGYIAHAAIEAILRGEQAELADAVFVHELTPGEGAENGIAASKDGAVILTNLNCYLLRAEDGVRVVWCTPYESAGAKVSGEGDKTTGGGLAWGGGCSPTLTPNLVMFTDNQDTVNLLALDMKTGEVAASHPVLDDLPEGYQVAVENSAIVYDNGEGTVSTIVCNWFGAGSAGLADPNSDSSIQSYANIYDMNWLMRGNVMIAPGVERVDTVKTADGYEMKSVWCRNDLSDTSILKLSTATGYIYGYVQDLSTGMWQYIILDFETGETVFTMDVSNKYGYNNMAIGMYAGNSGNALYCPTGYLELLRLQDRFVYLPEMPYRKVDLDHAARNVLAQDQFAADGGEGSVASWLNTAAVRNAHPNTTVAFRMNNLSGAAADLKLYAYGADGRLTQVADDLWALTDEAGQAVTELTDGTLYEVRVTVADGGVFDLSEAEKDVKLSVVLGK